MHSLNYNGHYWREDKEQVYFTYTTTLPRLGDVTAKMIAERYTFHGGEWSEWRIMRTSERPHGMGPKTAHAFDLEADMKINHWLSHEELYFKSWQKAVAQCIVRALRESRYGFSNAKRLLDLYRAHLTPKDHLGIELALEHLLKAEHLLEEVNADE